MIHKVKHFFRKPRPNVNSKILYRIFLVEALGSGDEKQLSYRHFCRLIKKVTCVKTVRTGGAEIDLFKLSAVISERAMLNVSAHNTISIDEKPVVLKNYLVRSCRVLKSHKGSLYKSMLYGIKMSPFYIIAAVSCDGMISFQIRDSPVHIDVFEAFITHVSKLRANGQQQFLLYDNATFHKITDECNHIIEENHFFITKTPPSGCFFDPIEEFFGIFGSIFKQKYQHSIVESGYYNPLSRSRVKDLIIESLIEADRSLIGQFRRALLY